MKHLAFAGLALALAFLGCGRNRAPLTPGLNGPTMVQFGDSTWLEANTFDPDGDSVSYLFDWRDGSDTSWTGPVPSGAGCVRTHAFPDTGSFAVRVRARDGRQETAWSEDFAVHVGEFGPFVPHRPSGRDSVAVGDSASYVTVAGHPLKRRVAFQFDWGDVVGDWSGFVDAGELYPARHAFTRGGLALVRARAKDTLEHVSDWSKPESVVVYEKAR